MLSYLYVLQFSLTDTQNILIKCLELKEKYHKSQCDTVPGAWLCIFLINFYINLSVKYVFIGICLIPVMKMERPLRHFISEGPEA